jgi:hypothetical protein
MQNKTWTMQPFFIMYSDQINGPAKQFCPDIKCSLPLPAVIVGESQGMESIAFYNQISNHPNTQMVQ